MNILICILKAICYFWLIFSKTSEKCVEIYHLDPANFVSAPGLAWQAVLKKMEGKLELLTDIDMLLMVEKELGEEYVIQFIDIQKLIINI